ncbi:unnamed protein product [Microthlaspi erraticum]|uniref:Lsm14-like N-terminal domain-containing protein n=1 Tax=Microthlaspi erraticum TaxID=1685480 RepID=A0A6D2KK77_9BRAS|nr:unnamed protein product [Microthlaspi erraticum]
MTEDKYTGNLLVPMPSSYTPYLPRCYDMAGSEIYEIGGGLNPLSSTKVWVSNELNGKCREAPSMLLARKNAFTCSIDGKFYVMGGCEADETTCWGEVFNPKTQTWEPLPDPGTKLRYSSIKNLDVGNGKGNIYVRTDEKSFVYLVGEGRWEVVEGSLGESVCGIENIWYLCANERCWWRYGDRCEEWRLVKGLSELDYHFRFCNGMEIVSCGGKLVIFWVGPLELPLGESVEIWCAVILLERRYDDEIWGHIEWFDVVLRVHWSHTLLRCVCGLRYGGVLYHFNVDDKTLGLHTVLCYGTEGRNNLGFQILPSNTIYTYILFALTEITDIIYRTPTRYGYGNVAKGATSSQLLPYNPHGAQKVPSISNEKLNEPQALITDYGASLVKGSVNERSLNPFAQPGYNGSSFYDPCSNQLYQSITPYGLPYQEAPILNAPYQEAPIINAPSEFAAPRSYFTTFPPVQISLRPMNSGGFVFEAVKQKFKQSEMWPQENKNQSDKKTAAAAYSSIDGSYYMVSRNPFDPIGRPCNPYGSIARPVKHHTKEISNGVQGMHQLQRWIYA